jgi:hypothetical protein
MATKQKAEPGLTPAVVAERTAALRRWRADWTRWHASPAAAAGLSRWRRRHPRLAGFATHEELVDGCGRDRTVPQRLADERLALLVGEARSGDRAAARVVLERVLPALVRAAVRQVLAARRPFGSALDDLLTSAWLVIVNYPLERRPAKIAVNIVRDAEYRQFGYVPAAIRESVPTPAYALPVKTAGLAGRTADDIEPAALEVLRLLAEAVRAGLPPADGRLLAELVVFGRTPEEVAARDGVTGRAVRFRRRAAIDRLAEQVASSCPSSDSAEASG